MDWKLELVAVPVSDVDRAKAFYTEMVGFVAEHDHTVSDELRFVQLTPPGSACSIALGKGIVDTPPGSVAGLHWLSRTSSRHGTNYSSVGWKSMRSKSFLGAPLCSSAIRTATAGPCSSFPYGTEFCIDRETLVFYG